MAVKVTEVLAQTGLAAAAIVMLTGSNGFTVMVTVLELAGFPEVQVSLEDKSHVMALPSAGINV